MALAKFEKVVTFSSEDKAFPASNLISSGSYKKWKTQKAGELSAFVVLKLQEETIVTGVDIGNEGSAFIEVQGSKDGKTFSTMVPNSSFMSAMEARVDQERNRVRMFTKFEGDMGREPILYLKIICKQSYNKIKAFGLSFIKVTGKSPNNHQMETTEESVLSSPPKPREIPASNGREVESDEDEPAPKAMRTQSASPRKPISVDTRSILRDIRFAISGFQNPLRSDLRSKGIALGARYETDWSSRCDFLICAFPNTPKWSEVAKSGGRAVTKDWIEQCFEQKKKLPWRDFKCGKYRDKVLDLVDSEDEDVNDEDDEYMPDARQSADSDEDYEEPEAKAPKKPSPSKDQQDSKQSRKQPEWTGGDLKTFFAHKRFHLCKDVDDPDEVRTLKRYIFAHSGLIVSTEDMAEFIVTRDEGESSRESAKIVSPLWIVKCHERKRWIDL